MKHLSNVFGSSVLKAQIFFVLAVAVGAYAIELYGLNLSSMLLILAGYFMYGCLGVVVTFHRYWTHQSYQTSRYLTNLFSLLGCFGGTGSPLAWANIHINHHLYSDKDGDPHSPSISGLKIFTLNYQVKNKTEYLRHVLRDPFQKALHRYYFLFLVVYGIVLSAIGGLYLLCFLFLIPAVITTLMSNVVNYVGHQPLHVGGYRNFNLKDQSSNNWLWAIPSWGESWHNNHHRFPKNSNFKIKWWELDISGLIISLIRI